MKILLINTHDLRGGAAKAAFRLHQGLHGIGLNSQMLVQNKTSEDYTVLGPVSKIRKGISLIRPYLDSLPLQFYFNRTKVIFSPALLPDDMCRQIKSINPDIIHLNWIAEGFVRLESLKCLNKPIVWTLHDSWAFTGGCHIPFECKRYVQSCGKCPTLGSSRDRDLSHWVWKRKKKAWRDLNLTLVSPSQWLTDCARASSLFHDYQIKTIPNGLDLKRFRPVDKHLARELLSLPREKKLILFGAMDSTSDRNKGFHFLLSALKTLEKRGWADRCEILIFGGRAPLSPHPLEFKFHYMGRLYDDISLMLLYSAADVIVSPSIQENLSNVVLESMACGTPCVAFKIGGMPDMIEHEQNGYLAEPFEIEDLANGIVWMLSDGERLKLASRLAREKSVKEFSIGSVARQYSDLYKELIV